MPETPAQTLVQAGIARGVLPPDAGLPVQESRPWPVVLLTALGAWLAAIPLLGVIGALLGGIGGWFFTGVLLVIAAMVILRARNVPAFVEQLAVPALLVGGGALGFGLFGLMPDGLAAAVLCIVALGLGLLVDRPWLRWLAGASASGLFMFFVSPLELVLRSGGMVSAWVALHLTFAVWVAALQVQQRVLGSGMRARWAGAVESLATGWLLPVLAGLAVHAGMTLLAGASLGEWRGVVTGSGAPAGGFGAMHAISALLAAIAALWLGRHWPSLRHPGAVVVAIVLAALSAFLPTLGAVLLALSLAAASQRWQLAGAAALAAAWIVGAFYYQLAWPLATKAIVLVVAGAALAACAWLAGRTRKPDTGSARLHWGRAGSLIVAAAMLTLGVANFAIWQKETLIARGDKVYVALAPVDPRSLMQGDFMRLRFALPAEAELRREGLVRAQRPLVVATRDGRGVAQMLRIIQTPEPLASGEFVIELAPKDGRWILVSDAWFFREGEAARFEKARFGEFRVLPDGKALLVGLADEHLQPLQP